MSETVTVSLDMVEWYPVLKLGERGDGWWGDIDVPAELYERYKAAMAEFEAVQNALHDIRYAAEGGR